MTFTAPAAGSAAFDEYVSDPAKPVPFRARPIQPTGYTGELTWSQWLVDDQREASGRPDVLTYMSEALKAPMKISGQPVAHLVASTSGTDADWVVKVIDVYPDEVAGQPDMGGYQLMVSADIFRGRYRESFETPESACAGHAAGVSFRAADGESRLPARPPDDGADPIELVPAVRSQPADLRPEHLLGEARRLSEGVQRVYHAPGPGQLRRAAAGHAVAASRKSLAPPKGTPRRRTQDVS